MAPTSPTAAGGATSTSGEGEEEEKKYVRSSHRMTPERVMEICLERKMYSQPHLNTQLYLNYKGFDTIEGLEDYSKVRALHLGNNNIARIEGLDRMSDLRSLHLENNRITVMENLDGNLELRQLNLEANYISCVAGIGKLAKLEHLSLAKNVIESIGDLEGLKLAPNLNNIDISGNQIEATEGVLEFLSSLSDKLKVLRYQGNPGVRGIEHYRKRLVNAMPQLSYLDERPIFPMERRATAAWESGGMEAMQTAKLQFVKDRDRQQFSVDPDRREHLTNMRKAAIARIEREAREREAEEEAKRALEAPKDGGLVIEEDSAAVAGDQEALDAYAKKWRSKVNLLGEDAVREQVAQQDRAQANLPPSSGGLSGAKEAALPEEWETIERKPVAAPAAAEATDEDIPALSKPAAALSKPAALKYSGADSASVQPLGLGRFAPPSRGAVVREAAAGAGAGPVSGAVSGSARWAHLRGGSEASDFRVSGGGKAAGSTESHQDRQFALLGGDEWTMPTPDGGDLAAGPAARGGPGGKAEPEVMPQIWERLAPAAKEAEKACLDAQNRAMDRSLDEAAPKPAPAPKNEDVFSMD